jgi:hypothetical protein
MSFSRPIQWYYSHVDPILPDGTFKDLKRMLLSISFRYKMALIGPKY